MRIRDGRVCPYYYVDAHRRARAEERCDLLAGTADAAKWTPALCETCDVPDIRRANSCPAMKLRVRVTRRLWGFLGRRRVGSSAVCTKSGTEVANPLVGCGQCHTEIEFVVAEEP